MDIRFQIKIMIVSQCLHVKHFPNTFSVIILVFCTLSIFKFVKELVLFRKSDIGETFDVIKVVVKEYTFLSGITELFFSNIRDAPTA